MAKNLFHRYIWLVEVLYSSGGASMAEIKDRWVRNKDISNGNQLPDRSFHNYKDAIQDTFNINIDYDRTVNKYYIVDDEEFKGSNVCKWLLNTFALQNLLNEGRGLENRIEIENVPSGEKYLTDIVIAMKENKVIQIVYHNFWRDTTSERLIEPYMLKAFKQRWYVVAHQVKDQIKIFALDRIKSLIITDMQFTFPKDFSPEEYFNDCFGVMNDVTIETEEVLIRVYGKQVNYFREVPLHRSQQEIESNTDNSIFSYKLRPTYELRRELQYKGDEVEVLSPEWFRKEIYNELRNATYRYEQ